MTNNIREILEDLYSIDPTLRNREQELIILISKLITLRPETRFDQAFAARLRRQLLTQADSAGAGENHMTFFEKIFSKPAYVIIGVVVIVIAAALTMQDGLVQNLRPDRDTKVVSYTSVNDNAFGSLSEISSTSPSARSTEDMAIGLGGGRPQSGGGTAMAMPSVVDSKASPLIYPGPDIVNYRFVYHGEEFDLPGDRVDVYRKVKGGLAGGDISAIIGAASQFMDFSTFSSTRVQSVNFYEDRDGGYQIYVDFAEGQISINERYPKIMESQDYSATDLPDKERMIAAADRFLAEHGVNIDGYGEPEVQQWWLETMAATTDAALMPRIADAGVIYPLLIAGKAALDQSGNPTGLVVNVRLSDMRVTGLWNLSTRNFESSAYAAETDRQKILDLAERGGLNNYYYPAAEDQTVKTVDVEIGTPTLSYIQYWKYDGYQGSELYIPAYVFPIINSDNAQIWQKYVIVPVVTELIDNAPPYSVPLMEGSSGVAR